MKQLFDSAILLHQQGKLEQAERIYRHILGQLPQQPDTLNALGVLLYQHGRALEAISLLRKAIKVSRDAAPIYINLGEACRTAGQFSEARKAFEKAIQLKPGNAEALFCLGSLLHDQNDLDKAIQHYRRVLRIAPRFAPAFNALGVASQELGHYEEAVEAFRSVLAFQQNYADAHLNLANTLYKLRDKAAAESHYLECLKLSPNMAQAHLGLAQLKLDSLIVSKENDLGIEAHLHAASARLSDRPEFLGVLGIFKARQGAWAESDALLSRVLQTRPDANVVYQYAYGKKFDYEDDLLVNAINMLLNGGASGEDRALLHFSYGKMLNDLKRYPEAFRQFSHGNDLVNAGLQHDRSTIQRQVDHLIEVFTPDFLAMHAARKDTGSQRLIFVVGMPRSGTTLTEQVISSHPAILGAGELFGMVALEQRIPSLLDVPAEYPEALRGIRPEQAENIAADYLRELENLFPGNYQRITDKFPLNFWRVGLIELLFPHAHIIHVKRDPMDCCLSNYFQKFSDGHTFAYDLANLGHYYLQYERLMEHWRQLMPGRIFELNYENLIADPEYWSRAMIEHIGLDWDDACLAPHKLERSVRTSSYWQVRQPIYKTSVQRWKSFEEHLDVLKHALGYQEKTDPRDTELNTGLRHDRL